MQIREALRDWDGTARLVWVVAVSAAFAALWVLQHGGGSWASRLWGAVLVMLAPALVAWPTLSRLARSATTGWNIAHRGSLRELEQLRRAGAI